METDRQTAAAAYCYSYCWIWVSWGHCGMKRGGHRERAEHWWIIHHCVLFYCYWSLLMHKGRILLFSLALRPLLTSAQLYQTRGPFCDITPPLFITCLCRSLCLQLYYGILLSMARVCLQETPSDTGVHLNMYLLYALPLPNCPYLNLSNLIHTSKCSCTCTWIWDVHWQACTM